MDLLDKVEKLCQRVGMPNLYVAYIAESAFAPPSGLSADTYLEGDTEGTALLRHTSTQPGVPLRATAAFATAATNELGRFSPSRLDDRPRTAIAERLKVPMNFDTADATFPAQSS